MSLPATTITAHYRYPPPLPWCFIVYYQINAIPIMVLHLILSDIHCHYQDAPLYITGTCKHYFSLQKTIEFSFLLSNAVLESVRVQIKTMLSIFFEDHTVMFKIRITAWRKHNKNPWHSLLRFSANCKWYSLYTMCICFTSWITNSEWTVR